MDTQNTGTPSHDEQGRPHPSLLSEREMMIEMLLSQRSIADLVNGFFGDLKSGKINPMQMMMGMMKGK